MASADGLILAAGGLTLASNFHKEGGFPSNGYATVGATVALTFLASTLKGTSLEGVAKGLGGLMLLAAIMTSVPAFTKGKKKENG